MEQSPLDSISTTLMEILRTTRLRTSSVSQRLSMHGNTLDPLSSTTVYANCWAGFVQRHMSGINRQPVESGTASMEETRWPVESQSRSSALNVERLASRKYTTQSSVAVSADSDSMPLSVLPVVKRHTLGRRPVYNLTVEGAHEYIANGFVVHNCDSAEMSIRLLNYLATGAWNEDEADILVA